MTNDEIIEGLKFTMDMCLFSPVDGSKRPISMLNDMDKITYNACEGAIQALEAQPCEDAVSREAIIGIIKELPNANPSYSHSCDVIDRADLIYVMERLESVQLQRKRGKWIFREDMGHQYCCSECGCPKPFVNDYYYKKIIGCPYCLADMRGDTDADKRA